MTDLKYWLWLTTRSELSTDICYRVMEQLGSPEEIYFAAAEEIDRLGFLRPVAKASLKDKSMDRPDRILSDCARLGVRISAVQDADYPERLKHIYHPPLVLYSRGRLIYTDEYAAIAMAGTRNCSDYGRKMADRLAYEITKQGGLVVTGVVPGCDYAAARAALRAGGPVVCVLAGGTDVPFDQYSSDLYAKVMENGMLVSEYPPGREPAGRNFPARNRILTGLCVGVLCVEGAKNSGTMLVAEHGLDQNRDLFAVPSGADRPQGLGTLELIKSGAIPVTYGSEVLAQYAGRYPGTIRRPAEEPEHPAPEKQKKQPASRQKMPEKEPVPQETAVDNLKMEDYIVLRDHRDEYTDDEQAVLLCLQEGDKTGDAVIAETGIPANRILSAITILTIRGLISEEPGGRCHALIRVRAE